MFYCNKCTAYLLARAGFDVWISNARGNTYSRRHVSLSPDDPAFWHFSWPEIAIYDYTAIYDHILNTTKCSKLYVCGHSQGTTTQFVLLSLLPEYNDKITALALMAPVTYLKHAGPSVQILAKLLTPQIVMDEKKVKRRYI